MVERIHSARHHIVFFAELGDPVFPAKLDEPRIVRTFHLENFLVPGLFVINVKRILRNRIDALEKFPDAYRESKRNRLDFQDGFDLVEQIEDRATVEIHLVDERDNRRVPHPADFHQLDRLLFDTVHAIDQNKRGIDRGERTISVFAKVLVPRRIDQVEPATFKRKIQHGTRNGNSAFLFDLHPVADRVAAVRLRADMPRFADDLSIPEKFFGNRGFSRIRVADNGKGSPLRDFWIGSQNGLVR